MSFDTQSFTLARWCRSITGGPSGRNLERELLPPSWLPIEDLVYRYLITMFVIVLCMVIAANFLQSGGKSNKGPTIIRLLQQPWSPIARTRSAASDCLPRCGVRRLGVILFPFVQANDFDVLWRFGSMPQRSSADCHRQLGLCGAS